MPLFFRLFKKASSNPLTMVLFLYAHHGQLHGILASLLQIQKADRFSRLIRTEKRSPLTGLDVFFSCFRDPEPVRKPLQNGSGDA